MQFRLGADPEFFLKEQGKLLSSINRIGGTKEEPLSLGDGFAIQEDNVAVEFNIPPAVSCTDFTVKIQSALARIRAHLTNKNISPNAIYITPTVRFPKKELANPKAMIFGCEPDFNAWLDGEVNQKPYCEDPQLRSAGGHIHVETTLDKLEVIKAMDLFLGVKSTELDLDKRRRQLYGKAGAFRPKTYGVEYRVLSNFWIKDNTLTQWVWNQTEKALNFVNAGNKINKEEGDLIQLAINDSSREAFDELLDIYPEAF